MLVDVFVPLIKLSFIIYMTYKIGFFWALLVFFAIYLGIIKLAEFALKMELISVFDSLFFIEYKGSPNIIQTMVIIEKIEYNSFKMLITQKGIKNFVRLRQRVDKYLNEFFWKEVSIEEAQQNIQPFPSEIRKMDAILNFLEHEFPKSLSLNQPMWKIYYNEHFNDSQSMFVLKYHHSLGDGVSLLNLFSGICDNFSLSELNSRTPQISLFQRIMLAVLSPYYVSKTLPKIKKEDVNPLARFSNKFSGENKLVMTKAFSFSHLRKIYKRFDSATFNDLAWTLLSRAVNQYTKSALNTTSNVVIGAMGVSFRTEIVPYELGNSSAGSMVRISTKEEFDDNLKDVIEVLKPLKSKTNMLGASYLLGLISRLFLNETLVKKAGESSFEKVSFIFTNVPGPSEKELRIGGKKVFDIIPFVPRGNLSFSVISFSFADEVRFNFHADRVYGPDIGQIAEILEKEINELVKVK